MITLSYSDLSAIDPQHGISHSEFSENGKYIDQYLSGIHSRYQGFYSNDVLGNNTGLLPKYVTDILDFAKRIHGKFTTIVLLGIGGSSLGAVALRECFTAQKVSSFPKLIVLDNIDPHFLSEIETKIHFPKTLFIAISKSGETPETVAEYFYFSKKIREQGLSEKEHIIFITDPKKGFFREESQKKDIPSFPIPQNVGGRFSVLTPVGLLPAALIGIDILQLLAGAREMRTHFLSPSLEKNTPFQLASMQFILYRKGKRQNVLYAYAQKLRCIADWFRQLVAESTGKRYRNDKNEIWTGITPLAALGSTDQHSQNQLYFEGPNDKFFLFLNIKSFQNILPIPIPNDKRFSYLKNTDFGTLLHLEMEGTKGALTKANRPHTTLTLSEISEKNIGMLFFLFESATAFLGEFFRINVFDQPGVELSKNITRTLLLERK
jgi:glucose-6-phosphate isomerase